MRIKRSRLINMQVAENEWEYFNGDWKKENSPNSFAKGNPGAMKPVCVTNKALCLGVAYVPGEINRYTLWTPCIDTPFEDHKAGHLEVMQSRFPWGHWHGVKWYENWEDYCFYWNLAPGWFSANGRKGVVVYTGVEDRDRYNAMKIAFKI